MRKAATYILAVISRIVFIGLCVQIIMGIFWMCGSFAGVMQFGESDFYVEVSKSFLCDEYTGVLYPVLLLFARLIEKLFHVPFFEIMYVLQLTYGACASHRFLQSIHRSKGFWGVWGSLAMLTVPMAMQCHMAILPHSLTGSCILMELSFVFDAIRKGAPKAAQLMKACAFWLAAALLMPEYLYLGALPVLFVFMLDAAKLWKDRKISIVYNLILVCAFTGLILGAQSLSQVEGSYGKMHRSIPSALVCRMAWTCLGEIYSYWPEELKECMDSEKITECITYADNMVKVFGPTIEQYVGVERAEEIYVEVAQAAWQVYRQKVKREILLDAVAYTVSPVALQLQLEGRAYESYSARNYEVMRERLPGLTKHYVNYSAWFFVVGLLLAAAGQMLCACLTLAFDRRIKSWSSILCAFCCVIFAAGLVGWYTMQGAGIMDYKNSVPVTCLWTAWMILTTEKGKMYAYSDSGEI